MLYLNIHLQQNELFTISFGSTFRPISLLDASKAGLFCIIPNLWPALLFAVPIYLSLLFSAGLGFYVSVQEEQRLVQQ